MIAPISIANSLPQLVTRVQEVIDAVNAGGGGGNSATANLATYATYANATVIDPDANPIQFETGSWTPTFASDGVSGTHTYTIRTGRYIKIGTMITCSFYAALSAKGGGMTGSFLRMGGLPYASVTELTDMWFAGSCAAWGNLNATYNGLFLLVKNGDTFGYLVDATQHFLAPSDLLNTSFVTGSFSYFTA